MIGQSRFNREENNPGGQLSQNHNRPVLLPHIHFAWKETPQHCKIRPNEGYHSCSIRPTLTRLGTKLQQSRGPILTTCPQLIKVGQRMPPKPHSSPRTRLELPNPRTNSKTLFTRCRGLTDWLSSALSVFEKCPLSQYSPELRRQPKLYKKVIRCPLLTGQGLETAPFDRTPSETQIRYPAIKSAIPEPRCMAEGHTHPGPSAHRGQPGSAP